MTRTEFSKKFRLIYWDLRRNSPSLLDKYVPGLTPGQLPRQTDKELIARARKYKSRKEIREKAKSLYDTIRNRGLREKAFKHMGPISPKHVPLTKEVILKSAKRYKTIIEWIKNDASKYKTAKTMFSNNFFMQCITHMKPHVKRVKCIELKKIFKNQKRALRFMKVNLSNKSAQRSLKKAIENKKYFRGYTWEYIN